MGKTSKNTNTNNTNTHSVLVLYHNRRTEVENKLATEHCSEEKKKRQLLSLGRKESQYLRLRRTRLGLEDFVTVKVIGKGAFGEVRWSNTIEQVK
jgi:hypothetical protein